MEAEKNELIIKERLKEVIYLFGDNFTDLAQHLGITYQSLSKKLNGHSDFKLGEIKCIQERYNIDADTLFYIFIDN